jgi:MATE family multidrug resistance protein
MAAMRRAAGAALGLGAGFMLLTGIAFMTVPRQLTTAFTPDRQVLGFAVALLPIAGVFQVFDGIQAVALGVLRGLGDTRIPVIVSVVGYWCLGLPAGLWLAFRTDAGAPGLWWGFVVGLGSVAAVLTVRLHAFARRNHARIVID